jgi:oxygen-independent coproporphyrinogen-3 oxidase
MCDLTVDLDAVSRQCEGLYGAEFGPELAALHGLAARGLVEINDRVVRVRNSGRPFVRLVAAVFDTYLTGNQGRHSIAV